MVCCVILGTIAVLLQTLWRWLTLQSKPQQSLFAPPAFRHAPGQQASLSVYVSSSNNSIFNTVDDESEPNLLYPANARRWSAIIPPVIVSTVMYMVVTRLLEAQGLLVPWGTDTHWWWRTLCYIAFTMGLMVVYMRAVWRHSFTRIALQDNRYKGQALVTVGIVWIGLGIIDLHVFEVLRLEISLLACGPGESFTSVMRDVGLHLEFHGVGLLAVGIGLWWSYKARTENARRHSASATDSSM